MERPLKARALVRMVWDRLSREARGDQPRDVDNIHSYGNVGPPTSEVLKPTIHPKVPIETQIFELDGSEVSQNPVGSPSVSSYPLEPVGQPFMAEPFVVTFNMYSNGKTNAPVLTEVSRQLWDVSGRESIGEGKLCSKCQSVRLLPTKFQHWNFEEMTTAIQNGCPLCTYVYENSLHGRDLNQVKTWFEQGRAFIVVKPASCQLAFMIARINGLGDLYMPEYKLFERNFELYRLRKDVDPSMAATDPIHRREIDSDPTSEASLTLVKSWLDNCLLTHDRCSGPQDFVPTRLIDVSGHDPVLVSLISSSKLKYTALSHCWGNKPVFQTTTKNRGDNMRHISVSSLPKSFVDAIVVTQRLGIRYLWIDSICILQDSEEDWNLESSRMRDIYQNAFLTISALDAPDSHVGFLTPRFLNPWPDNSGVALSGAGANLYVRALQPAWDWVFDPAPLNNRAWTLQERLLSTRILHYAQKEMFWECYTCSTRESSIEEQDTALGAGLWSEGTDFKRLLYVTPGDRWPHEVALSVWYRLLQNYTRRFLTRQSDKLAAIAGIASLIAQVSGFMYRHGLWEEDIKMGLMWMIIRRADVPQDSHRIDAPKVGVEPSWSWISTKRSISTDYDLIPGSSYLIESAQDLRLITIKSTVSKEQAFFGESSKILSLKGVVRPVRVTCPTRHHAYVHDPESNQRFSVVTLDQAWTSTDLNDVLALWIQQTNTECLYFMLIMPSDRVAGAWKRLGVGKALGHQKQGFGPFNNHRIFGESEMQRIDLV